MTRVVPDERLRAVHESAHACVALALGIPIYNVHLGPCNSRCGGDSTDAGGACHGSLIETTRDAALIALAAACAAGDTGTINDRRHLDDARIRLDFAEVDRVLPSFAWYRYRRDAERLVAEYRDAIEHVASALLRERYLTGEQVRELLAVSISESDETRLVRELPKKPPAARRGCNGRKSGEVNNRSTQRSRRGA